MTKVRVHIEVSKGIIVDYDVKDPQEFSSDEFKAIEELAREQLRAVGIDKLPLKIEDAYIDD